MDTTLLKKANEIKSNIDTLKGSLELIKNSEGGVVSVTVASRDLDDSRNWRHESCWFRGQINDTLTKISKELADACRSRISELESELEKL